MFTPPSLTLVKAAPWTTTATDGVVDVSGAATIMGNVDAGTLKLGGTSTIAGNASVDVATLDSAGSQRLTIGEDGDAEGKGSSSAAVFADTFIMGAGSTLFVDQPTLRRLPIRLYRPFRAMLQVLMLA